MSSLSMRSRLERPLRLLATTIALKLDQWNEQGVFGMTEFGVADHLFGTSE